MPIYVTENGIPSKKDDGSREEWINGYLTEVSKARSIVGLEFCVAHASAVGNLWAPSTMKCNLIRTHMGRQPLVLAPVRACSKQDSSESCSVTRRLMTVREYHACITCCDVKHIGGVPHESWSQRMPQQVLASRGLLLHSEGKQLGTRLIMFTWPNCRCRVHKKPHTPLVQGTCKFQLHSRLQRNRSFSIDDWQSASSGRSCRFCSSPLLTTLWIFSWKRQ